MRALAACLLVLIGVPAWAGERYALVISGASGGEKYAQTYEQWRTRLVATLTEKFGMDPARVTVLTDAAQPASRTSTAENVRRVLASLKGACGANDLLLVVLIGHGTSDGSSAKFNLVGPDLTAEDWRVLLDAIACRAVIVNTTAGSFPFLSALSGRNRIVITATDSPAQRYETIFPEFFVRAMDDPAADLDKNGRISLWEAFTYASVGVKQWYEQRGQLATERAVLDDNGDKQGKEPDGPGPDGLLARSTYFDQQAAAGTAGAAAAELAARREKLVADVEALKARKASMAEVQYYAELEKLLIEIAMITRQMKGGS